jgi:hypothetical protein
MPTFQGNIAEQLEPGIREIVGDGFREVESFYPRLVRVSDSDKAAEHILEFNYFGMPALKSEGRPMATDEVVEGPKKNISHIVYALAAEFSWEALSDEKYGKLKGAARELGKSMRELIEIQGHMLYNDGFTTETAIDGLSVFNTAHVNRKLGNTWSNRVATDLTLGSIQQMFTDFMNMTDGTGKHIVMRPEMLIIPPETWVTAGQILETALEPFTTDNTKNVVAGKLQTIIDPYITDTDSWFVRASMSDINAHFFFRERPMQDSWDDKKSRISAFATIVRIGRGVSDPHGLYGSPGA